MEILLDMLISSNFKPLYTSKNPSHVVDVWEWPEPPVSELYSGTAPLHPDITFQTQTNDTCVVEVWENPRNLNEICIV